MAYGYKRRTKRTYKRKTYRKKRVKRGTKRYRSSKRTSSKGNVLVPMPGRFYQLSISRTQYNELKRIYAHAKRAEPGLGRVEKAQWKAGQKWFIREGVLGGLTDKLFEIRNAAKYAEEMKAMRDSGVFVHQSAQAANEPVNDPGPQQSNSTGGYGIGNFTRDVARGATSAVIDVMSGGARFAADPNARPADTQELNPMWGPNTQGELR